MPLRLELRCPASIPIEVEGLVPERVAGQSLAEIERLEIPHGNRLVPAAELFRITGSTDDERLEFCGDLRSVHWIGARMSRGAIQIEGSCGRHLGSELSGGTITVSGDAGAWVGAEMRGGMIHIRGNAGPMTGGAYRGSTRGMRGGQIFVDGNAGHEVGHSMRRGLIAVAGTAGDMVGCNMIAGTILVFGRCGRHPGAGMRRGTLGLFGSPRPDLLPTFRYGSTFPPGFLRVILRDLAARRFFYDSALHEAQYDLYHGDLITLGRGEILFPRDPAGN